MSILDRFKKKDRAVKSEDKKTKVKGEVKKTETKKPAKSVSNSKSKVAPVNGILIRPIITEKATDLAQFNQYVFEVSTTANKIQIAQAIYGRYNVKPIKVNVVNHPGKTVRFGRNIGRTKKRRKAVVTLAEGQSIQIHEGV